MRRPKVCSTSQGPKCCFEDCVDPKRPYAEKPSSAESGEREVPAGKCPPPFSRLARGCPAHGPVGVKIGVVTAGGRLEA